MLRLFPIVAGLAVLALNPGLYRPEPEAAPATSIRDPRVVALLSERFPDLASVQVRGLSDHGDGRFCGEMDSKDETGAFQGMRPFAVKLETGEVITDKARAFMTCHMAYID